MRARAKNVPRSTLSRTRPHLLLPTVVLAVVSSSLLLGWNRGVVTGDDGGGRSIVIASAFVPPSPPSSRVAFPPLPSTTTTTTAATRRRRGPSTIVGRPHVASPLLSLLGGDGDDEYYDSRIDGDDIDFDESERRGATFFGLEPKASARDEDGNSSIDPMDDGLRFTGPIVMMISLYVTLSLFFGNDDVAANL
jgi:hypothetical protein